MKTLNKYMCCHSYCTIDGHSGLRRPQVETLSAHVPRVSFGGVLGGESDCVRAVAARVAQAAGVRHNVPRENERHVRVAHQSVALVPHIVFGVRAAQLESRRVTGPAFERRTFKQRN